MARSYWRVELTNGRTIRERDTVAGGRLIDWSLDLVSTGDVKRIKKIFLDCPMLLCGSLSVEERQTVFQFKTKQMQAFGAIGSNLEFQCIGKVVDKENGDCVCLIYDRIKGLFRYDGNIKTFGVKPYGMWRDSLLPIGSLEENVLGVSLR